jgi:hypothetical protein
MGSFSLSARYKTSPVRVRFRRCAETHSVSCSFEVLTLRIRRSIFQLLLIDWHLLTLEDQRASGRRCCREFRSSRCNCICQIDRYPHNLHHPFRKISAASCCLGRSVCAPPSCLASLDPDEIPPSCFRPHFHLVSRVCGADVVSRSSPSHVD